MKNVIYQLNLSSLLLYNDIFILHETGIIITQKVSAVISLTMYIWNMDLHANWTDLAYET